MSTLVKGEGPKDADIVILGEAPGKQEASRGRPFIGRSGKLLTRLLRKAGIVREHCYITNVVKERPKGNDISRFIDPPSVTDAGKKYIRSLRNELHKLDPNVIVPVGNIPLWVLTSNTGITNWRGSILQDERGYKVIPTIHPAAALRYYMYRYYILFDLKRVREESTFPEIDRDERTYLLRPTFKETMTYLEDCLDNSPVGFDIEVNSNREVSCISFSYQENHAISIPFVDSKGGLYWMQEQEKAIWLKIEEILSDPDVHVIAHNAAFDATFLYRKYGIPSKNVEDTMIAHNIVYPDFRHALSFLTTQYTDIPYYKEDKKTKFKSQNNEQFWKYNARDSIVLSDAFPKLVKELDGMGNIETYKSQRNLLEPLLYINAHGLRVDVEGLRERRDKMEDEIEGLERELMEITGRPINPRSVPQLKDYFYDHKGVKPYISRSTGNPTTNEKALKRLAGEGGRGDQEVRDAASVVLKIRKKSKMKGTYYDMDLHEDNRLRSSMNPAGTTTGRLSSSQDIFGRGGNIQNLPTEFKEFILPDEGYVGYEIDLGQAENRVVAYYGPSPNMMEAFERGIDIHSKTAALIFDLNVDEVVEKYARYQEGDKSDDLLPDIGQGNKTHRGWGKQANHAFNYDMGYRKAALNWEISETDAKWIYNEYHKAYPGVKKMHEKIDAQLNQNRVVENILGRKRKFFGRWNEIKKDAYSYVAQSTVADIINRYGVCGVYYDQDRFGDVTLLSQVHDSIWIQIPKDLGWHTHAHLLDDICDMMEPQLEWEGREFVIPAEVTMLPNHFAYGHEFEERPGPEDLANTYNDLRKEKVPA